MGGLSVIRMRMPVIVEPTDWPVWLGEAKGEWRPYFVRQPEDLLRCGQSAERVGNVKNDGPELLEPSSPEAPVLL